MNLDEYSYVYIDVYVYLFLCLCLHLFQCLFDMYSMFFSIYIDFNIYSIKI